MIEHADCPDVILDAIPWYPEQLSEQERGAVEAHAADCAHCRAELAFLLEGEEPTVPIPDPGPVLARVMERIASDEEPLALEGPNLRRDSARPAALAAGVAVAALLGALLGGGGVWYSGLNDSYEVASASAPAGEAKISTWGYELEIVFRPDATAEQIGRGLREAGVSLISGPSPRGVYRARLDDTMTFSSARALLRGEGENAAPGIAIFVEPGVGG